ncbi:uncharacterized protein LOC133723092 [Rosa rugosa]|uniref:uncharacterized protein LOC133723092 n=1 Tax=Rosa rugosa TaxID=74645 RepID=UPI002B407610|nr:uncharacterized protein LOC133723092 [Rosa rugosa]
MYQQYIANQTDVDMDGNCGYRVVTISMGFGHDGWRTVRKHLLDELRGNRTFYEDHIFGAKRFHELENCLDYFVDGFAPENFWMTMPDMGHIIATCYGVTVIHLSSTMCITFLPLYNRNECRNEYRGDCEGGEFAIGYVGRHFVKVNLISQSVPIPPVTPLWHKYQVNNGQLYNIYEQRIDQFKKLENMEDAATTDTFADIVHLDID